MDSTTPGDLAYTVASCSTYNCEESVSGTSTVAVSAVAIVGGVAAPNDPVSMGGAPGLAAVSRLQAAANSRRNARFILEFSTIGASPTATDFGAAGQRRW